MAVYCAPDIASDVSESLRQALEDWAADPSRGTAMALQWSERPDEAHIALQIAPLATADPAATIAEHYYAVVVPFDTLPDGIMLDDISQRWLGLSSASILYVTPESEGAMRALMGGDTHAAEVVPADEMLAHLLERRDAVGLLPFERLDRASKC